MCYFKAEVIYDADVAWRLFAKEHGKNPVLTTDVYNNERVTAKTCQVQYF